MGGWAVHSFILRTHEFCANHTRGEEGGRGFGEEKVEGVHSIHRFYFWFHLSASSHTHLKMRGIAGGGKSEEFAWLKL